MKNIFLYLFVFLPIAGFSQAADCKAEATAFREKQNTQFRNESESPLTKEDREHFKKLKFFKYNPAFCVEATFVPSADSSSFQMPTSNPDRSKTFVKTGVLHFSIHGKAMQISVYKNLGLPPEYENHLFIPFRDLTSGKESYGGGRYIDLIGPLGETVKLDFNQCYNPYCAYSTGWSCPIPPKENDLSIEVKAGTRAWQH